MFFPSGGWVKASVKKFEFGDFYEKQTDAFLLLH